jgi:hypothetical protein
LSFGEKMRYVIGPQALRIAVPPTVGFLVQVIKGTALASGDRLHRADQGRHDDHQRHLPPLPRLRLRGAAVLRAVLPHFLPTAARLERSFKRGR